MSLFMPTVASPANSQISGLLSALIIILTLTHQSHNQLTGDFKGANQNGTRTNRQSRADYPFLDTPAGENDPEEQETSDDADDSMQTGSQDHRRRESPASVGITGLFGQVAKTVVYGGAALVQLNSALLCPLLKHETEKDNEDQPILFVFNNNMNKEQAYRIYSDDEISEQIVEEAQFDPQQMTLIFVHGWMGGIQKELWLSEAKNAALENSFIIQHRQETNGWRSPLSSMWREPGSNRDSKSVGAFRPNVIIVDWSEFAAGTLFEATQNSLKVSHRLARLLGQLHRTAGLRPNLMHCLGHSIGTHICGQAARQAFPARQLAMRGQQLTLVTSAPERRFGRISGLDPGGFCYELDVANETSFLGLKPSDALLVDAYYSNRSPFGNRYQVAQYNVRLNNGFFQKPCSVWKNPQVAREYFRTAIRYAISSTGAAAGAQNELLTCDHYFATRLAGQLPPTRICSYVGYRCDSYRNYLRGKCGTCSSPAQCYTMEFEYQVRNPTIEHALRHIRAHSSLYTGSNTQEEDGNDEQAPIGGVAYEERRTYYMRVADEEPYCSLTFRVRVFLDRSAVDLRSFKADWLKLRFFGSAAVANSSSSLKVKDANRRGRTVNLLSLHGPWSARATNELAYTEEGLDERTLTALFELDSTALQRLMRSGADSALESPIESIHVEYNNELNRRQVPLSNPIEFIQLDYLSSTDLRLVDP